MNLRPRIAVVGAGYWGSNVVRDLHAIPSCDLVSVCDHDPAVLERMGALYPELPLCRDAEALLRSSEVDAVAVVTEAPGHFDLARRALEAGKHVYVEKPLCLKPAHADELVRLASQRGCVLMVGHLMKYHPAICWLHQQVVSGKVGRLQYLKFSRLNLGIVRSAETAWWSLAPHDISIALWLMGGMPARVSAWGGAYLQPDVADIASAVLAWPDGRAAHIHVSWLSPDKVRRLSLVGSKRLISFDDMERPPRIRIRELSTPPPVGIPVPSGDSPLVREVPPPSLSGDQPLLAELQHFVDCVGSGESPRTDGAEGLDVVRILAAGDESISRGGAAVSLG